MTAVRRAWLTDEADGDSLRAQAEAAARRSGLPLGAWLDAVIAETSEQAGLERRHRRGYERGQDRGFDRAVRGRTSYSPGWSPRGRDDIAEVFDALSDMAARVTAAEAAAREALDLAEERLQRAAARPAWRGDDLAEVDRRLEAAQADLFAAEDEARQTLRSIMGRTRPARDEGEDRLSAVTSAFSTLERRVDEMMRKLETRPEPPPPAPAREDSELLAQIRARLDALAQRVETPRPPDRRLETTLQSLDSRLSDLSKRVEAPPAPDRRIETTLRSLEERIADIGKRLNSPPPPAPDLSVRDERLAKIEAQLSEISEHLSRSQDDASRPATFTDQLQWERDRAAGDSDLAAAIRDIAARQKALEADLDPAVVTQALDHRFREMSESITRRLDETAAGQSIESLQAQVRKLAESLEQSRKTTVDSSEIQGLQRQVTALHRTLESAVSQTSLAAVVAEVRSVAERLEAMRREGRASPELAKIEAEIAGIRRAIEAAAPREAFESLQAQIAAVARHLESRPQAVDPETFSRLSAQVDDVKRHIADAMPNNALNELVAALRTLDRKIDQLHARESGGGAALDALRTEIADLRGALHAGIERPGVDPALNGRIERLLETVADSASLRQVEARLAELSERVQAPSSAPFPDRVLEDIRARLDEVAMARPAAPALDVASLEGQINALAAKLDQFGRAAPGAPQTANIEAQIGRLAETLSLSHEHTLEAARAAASDAVRSALTDLSGARGDAETDRLVRDLHASLMDLRSATDATDRRTHDTLIAVHDTLRKVVERLAQVDQARTAATHAPPQPQPQPQPAPLPPLMSAETVAERVAPPEPIDVRPAPAAPAAPPRDAKAAVAAAREAAARAAALKAEPLDRMSPDMALEPGSGRPRQPMTAADAVRAAREQIKANETKTSDEDVRESFITAARRAVQASVDARRGGAKPDKKAEKAEKAEKVAKPAEKVEPTTEAADKTASTKSRIWSGGAKRLAGDAPPEAPVARAPKGPGFLARLGALPEGRRKQIVMAVAAVVIILGAVQVISGFLASQQADAPVAEAPVSGPGAVASLQEAPAAPAPQAPVRAADPSPQDAPSADTAAPAAPEAPPAPAATAGGIDLPALPDNLAGPKLLTAARSGDVRALYEIGNRLAEGRGAPRDLTAAVGWWRLGADRAHAPAIYRLANAIEKGQGANRDPREAIRLYQRSADLGNRKAMHNLAALLAAGADGGRPDYDRAFPLFLKAAEQGLVDSQFNLAVLYVNGLGTRQNLTDAYTWFHVAAQNGDREAGNRRDEVARRLDATALVNARMAAQQFRPKPFDPAANEEVIPPGAFDEPAPARTSRGPVEARPNLGIQVGATNGAVR